MSSLISSVFSFDKKVGGRIFFLNKKVDLNYFTFARELLDVLRVIYSEKVSELLQGND